MGVVTHRSYPEARATSRANHWRQAGGRFLFDEQHEDDNYFPVKKHRIFSTSFASVYPHYVKKAEAKGRTRQDVDTVIRWLTGYSPEALREQIEEKKDFETFFGEAPALNPNVSKITGVICGVRIEAIDDPLMRNIRYMDKLVDEVAKGRPMDKILRK